MLGNSYVSAMELKPLVISHGVGMLAQSLGLFLTMWQSSVHRTKGLHECPAAGRKEVRRHAQHSTLSCVR